MANPNVQTTAFPTKHRFPLAHRVGLVQQWTNISNITSPTMAEIFNSIEFQIDGRAQLHAE